MVMKKEFTFLILISIFSLNVFAGPVNVQTAKQVGQSFLTKPITANGMLKMKKQQTNLELIYTADTLQINSSNQLSQKTAQKIVPFYVFTAENQGYVIVAGDDRLIPILGYADVGVFDTNNIPPNMQKWLEGYKAEIRYAIENNIVSSSETQAKWQTLQSGLALKSPTQSSSVAPLISTKWNQSPYYNNTCPYNSVTGERTVTGCVATAMAQVMKYWNYPSIGSGFHSYNHSTYGTLSANFGNTTYDWANMTTQLTSSSSSTQINAVATLMNHCGVSVDMNYGIASAGGSSAYVITSASPVTNCTEYALKTYFNYKTTLQGVQKANYTDLNWLAMLKTEIDAGRPMVYAGFGDGGHCFVCDGYDNNNYFHFNWGWGGYYDGYFALNALNPGSGGIGGGSYTYNDGQQAIIGIEPSAGGTTAQNIDLRLYASLNMPSTKIWFKSAFSLSTDIANYGTSSFNGDLAVAVFNDNYEFVDFIEAKSGMSLTSNTHYTNGLTFSNSGITGFVPGTYYAALFYKTSTQDWTIVSDGNYTNWKQFEIYYSSSIEVNSGFTITTNGGKLIQGQPATVNVDITNTSSTVFYGQYRLNLANLDGSWAQNIQILNENNGLGYNYHYIGGNNFSGTISVEPGTYLMEVGYQSSGTSSWIYAGSTNYSNPVYVIVEAPTIQPDIYEINNTQLQAYNLPLSFSNNIATKNTNGSNFHIGTDIDYYKVVLPSGYNYSISPRLHDNYNSGNGLTYTVDALFSYSINGTTYSEIFDDIMTGNIAVNNGGTVYFKVAPYFSGNTGTYLLDLNITRNAANGIDEVESNTQISLYPNPAKEFTTIYLPELTKKISHITLCDLEGRQIYSLNNISSETNINLALSQVSSGIYFVHIYVENEVITKKLIVSK